MLITCKECGQNISDKRQACPHCGMPLKHRISKQRLPNGFGQISKIQGQNLRKPYRAMITVGYRENGRPICKILQPEGYFFTYNEAYTALVEYHKNPDPKRNITMDELFYEWSERHFQKVSRGTRININGLWKFCHKIYDERVTNIKRTQIRDRIENGDKEKNGKIVTPTNIQKPQIKILIGQLLDYAMEIDLIDKNVAKNIHLNIQSEPKEPIHTAFSDEELSELWNKDRNIYEDIALVLCYSGWRPGEVLDLTCENINMEEGTFTGGSKTSYGKNRTVPIHSKILLIIRKYFGQGEYLFCFNGEKGDINKFRTKFYDYFPTHYPHDGRKTFVTLAKKYNVDEYAIKRIVGHSIQDLTERVYTERSIEWLRAEIEKIE